MNVAAHFSRYALVSGLCLILHNAVLIGGDLAGIPYPAGVAASFALCVLVGYRAHSRWTFPAKTSLAGLWRYTAAMLLNLPLTLVSLLILHDLAGWPMWAAAPLSTIALLAFNYFAGRWAIQRPRVSVENGR